MNFTDDDLKRLKEDIEKNKTRTGIRFNLHYRTSVIEALLARLEAAEDELLIMDKRHREEIDRLKAELELQKETCKNGFEDRDLWKSRAEKLAEALRRHNNGICQYRPICKDALSDFEAKK